MAKIYDKTSPGPSDHVLILAVREPYLKPFEATDWTDLRVGCFLSITDETGDDTITALGPDIIGVDNATPLQLFDRVIIGVHGGTTAQDYVLLGYTNAGTGRVSPSLGQSKLITSDAAVGTTNANYWRATNGRSDRYATQIIQSGITRAFGGTGEQPHFPQANIGGGGGPAGYASLFMLRFTRDSARGRERIITMQVAHDPTVTLYSSTPTNDILNNALEAFPTTSIHTLGPVELSHVQERMYWYWPFHNSRLRIHSDGILKAG